MGRIKKGKILEVHWVCECCGTKMLGRYRECKNCGSPKDKSTTFDKTNPMPLTEAELKNVPSGPDWYCPYCDSLNSNDDYSCKSCAAPKTTTTYHDLRREENKKSNEITRNDYKVEDDYIVNEDIKKQNETKRYTSEYSSLDSLTSIPQKERSSSKKRKSTKNYYKKRIDFSKILTTIGSVFLALIIGIGIVFAMAPKTETIEIQNLSWKREIRIDKEQPVKESGWTVPIGARVYDEKEEFYKKEKVVDYVEEIEVEKTRDVFVGTEDVVIGYEDLGNGYVQEIIEEKDIYETETYTETEEITHYKFIDVYKTKYYYEIDKYLYERSVVTHGNDKNVYWGDLNLKSKEKESSRSESYVAIATNEDEEIKQYNFSYDDWLTLEVGDVITIKSNAFMVLEIIK